MGIRDRLDKLERARAPEAAGISAYENPDGTIRVVYQLEGQSEEEAHRLSAFPHEPLERCFIMTEAMERHCYFKTDGDYVDCERRLAQIRADQEARRAVD